MLEAAKDGPLAPAVLAAKAGVSSGVSEDWQTFNRALPDLLLGGICRNGRTLSGRRGLSPIRVFRGNVTAEQIDLIVLDLILPDMHGHKVLSTLRLQKVHTPVLVLSGDATVESILRIITTSAAWFALAATK